MADKKKHIAIIEMEGHPHLLQKYMDLLIINNVELYIFTTDWIINLLKSPNSNQIHFVIKDNETGLNKYLLENKKHLEKCDYTLIGTITKEFKTFYYHLSNKSYGIVAHNLNYFFDVKNYLSNNLLERIKSIYLAFPEEQKYKRRIIEDANNIFTLSEYVRQYAKKIIAYEYKIKKLSLTFSNPPLGAAEKNKIIIPGGINSKNRDYSYLFQWISDNSQINLDIIFCGKSDNHSDKIVINKIDTFSNIKYEVFYNYLSNEQYANKMIGAMGMICPMKRSVEYKSYKELYGKSKVSGSIDDAITFNVPLLLPSFYPLDSKLVENYYYPYENYEDFSMRMHQLTKGKISTPSGTAKSKKEMGKRLLDTLIRD